MVSFMHQQNIICSQTKLDNIGHEQTIIYRQLFPGHMVGSRPKKRNKHLQQMIRIIIHPREKLFSNKDACFIYVSQTRECPVECE